ncbi:MAG: GHKL domain-containing protein [Lachnospiraceae bacterium]|nr:GHKL domain-containing protein [Lachnospiraceae bacterium]
MMGWYQIISFLFTNGLRIFFGLYLVMAVLRLSGDRKKAGVLSACAAVFITLLSCLPIPQIYIAGAEIVIMMLIIRHLFRAELRMPLFLTFFYEITVALWEFIISAGLGIIFRSEDFLDRHTLKYMAAVWIVRALMLGIAFLALKAREGRTRVISAVAVAGLFGVIFLSGQSIITIDDEQMTTWIIFSMLILVAVLFFYLSRQYEMEKKIAHLEKEKNALLTRDYQLLKNTYAANARLFHDFHNHIEALHRYLEKDRTAEAVQYLENLRSPIEAVTQPVWVGDEAVDYLISSKITLAASRDIQVNCNIEYPQHTNIRSVDLVAILGNLLDNALEAVEGIEENLRFINLTIRRINEMLIIKLENGCKAAPVITAGELKTTKQDTDLHGWGLKSVRTTAEHYDGTVETEYGGGRFCTVVTLSYEPVKTE